MLIKPACRPLESKKNKKTAYLSQKIATIIRDMPIYLNLENCHIHTLPAGPSRKIIQELEFKSLIKPLEDLIKNNKIREVKRNQPSLF